jgi:hypothetical protein
MKAKWRCRALRKPLKGVIPAQAGTQIAFAVATNGLLAPSMALALRAAFGVRVCNSRIKSGTGSANTVPLARE